jgi:hypothetical protein
MLEHNSEKWIPILGKKIMLQYESAIPKSGCRFSEKITLHYESMIPKKPALGLDHRKSDVSDLRPL